MTDYLTTDTELTSIADAIRTKGGTSESLEYPTDFVSAIENIQSGGGLTNPIRFGLVNAYAVCENGMTWREYVSWDYCIGTAQTQVPRMFEVIGSYVGYGDFIISYYDANYNTVFVNADDAIVADRSYFLFYND